MCNNTVSIGMKPPHRGDFIRTEILEALDLSIARAAAILDVWRATLSDLVNGKTSLSPEMALNIEKVFGVSMDTLLRMQAWHGSYTMREYAGGIHVKPSSKTFPEARNPSHPCR